MPELPEVETIRRGLARNIIGRKIQRAIVRKPKIVRGSARRFAEHLKGKSFSNVRRHGKLLILPIANSDLYLLIHLKMTGQLIYQKGIRTIAGGHGWPPVGGYALPNKYTHVQFDFTDGSALFFNDLRQFGFLELVDKETLDARLAHMGIDPLLQELTWEDFRGIVAGRQATIKAVLLNQQLIAGIGNIYADEVCFAAHVRPQRRAQLLTVQEQRALWRAIPHVLERALTYGGTTFRDYRDTEGGEGNFAQLLKVYGRGGKQCRRAGCRQAGARGIIKKVTVAQRGTHYCPNCQK